MAQRSIRRIAAAAAIATALAVTAPAQAASGHTATGGPGWLKAAVHWVASLLPVNWMKGRQGIDPDGLTSVPPPPQDAIDKSFGIDPDG